MKRFSLIALAIVGILYLGGWAVNSFMIDAAKKTLAIAEEHGVTVSWQDDPNTRTAEEVKKARELLTANYKLQAAWYGLLSRTVGEFTNATGGEDMTKPQPASPALSAQQPAAPAPVTTDANRFSDYPVSGPVFTGPHAAPDLSIPYGKSYRTRITAASHESPNFARRYAVAFWGCGTGCAQGVAVNVATGKVIWLPPSFFVESYGAEHFEYRIDSRLLVVHGHVSEDDETVDVPRCYVLDENYYPRLAQKNCNASDSDAASTNTVPQRPPQQPAPAPAPTVSAAYRAALSAWLESHKDYPESARQRAEEGRAVLRFRVARSGRVLDYSIVSSTGYADLDATVEAMIRGASLPPFPPDMTVADIDVSVPISFNLASAAPQPTMPAEAAVASPPRPSRRRRPPTAARNLWALTPVNERPATLAPSGIACIPPKRSAGGRI